MSVEIIPGDERKHECETCGYVWESVDDSTAKHVRNAAKVNGCGPYCGVCGNLEMASRYAEGRGELFTELFARWVEIKTLSSAQRNP